MHATIDWIDTVHFQARSQSGHVIPLDGPEASGGTNRGARPMELMLMGLGGCTSFDVVEILRKGRQNVTNCRTELTAERADTVPQTFTEVTIHFVVEGVNLNPSRVARAVTLSAEKYCSASIMLERAGVQIRHSHEIREVPGKVPGEVPQTGAGND